MIILKSCLYRKWHALWGNLLSLFWIEIVDDALQEISKNGSDPFALLTKLKKEEDMDYQPLTSRNTSMIRHVDRQLNDIEDVPNDMVYWGSSYCHTARTPSQIRYEGILTESDLKGGYTRYDKGEELGAVRGSKNDKMPLVWDKSLYQTCCDNHQIDIDNKDFFLVNSNGWSNLVLPNPSEEAYYADYNKQPIKGYISICLASCGWSCPKDVLSWADLRMGGRFSMAVNGMTVQNYTNFGGLKKNSCAFLKHSKGHKWKANDDGRFEISAKSLNDTDYARISSFVIW